jgi:predicted nucleic acid-binding protein
MTPILRYVIDTNIAIKLLIPDPLSTKAETLFLHLQQPQSQFFIPDLFYIELTNVLWKYVRTNQYPADQVQTALQRIQSLPLNVTPTKDLMIEAANLSLKHNISAYDAAYVALSQRINVPLLTLDNKLVTALITAPELDVQLFSSVSIPPSKSEGRKP